MIRHPACNILRNSLYPRIYICGNIIFPAVIFYIDIFDISVRIMIIFRIFFKISVYLNKPPTSCSLNNLFILLRVNDFLLKTNNVSIPCSSFKAESYSKIFPFLSTLNNNAKLFCFASIF